MSIISAYKQAAVGQHSDFAYAAKHPEVIHMGTYLPVRGSWENEPGGIAFLADICQSHVAGKTQSINVDVVASGAMLYDQIWLGSSCLVVLDSPILLQLHTDSISSITLTTVKNTLKTNLADYASTKQHGYCSGCGIK